MHPITLTSDLGTLPALRCLHAAIVRSLCELERMTSTGWTWDGTVTPGMLSGKCSYTALVRRKDATETDELWALFSPEGTPCWMVASDHPEREGLLAYVPVHMPRPLPPAPPIGMVIDGWQVTGPAVVEVAAADALCFAGNHHELVRRGEQHFLRPLGDLESLARYTFIPVAPA